MIIQSLQYTLFGMLGIFLVMGLIILIITLLTRFSKPENKNGTDT